jgi:hypothetical protein
MTRPPLEVADVVRQYAAEYLARYGAVTSTAQRQVLQAVVQCRTAALGGHKSQCDPYEPEEISCNSCRKGRIQVQESNMLSHGRLVHVQTRGAEHVRENPYFLWQRGER